LQAIIKMLRAVGNAMFDVSCLRSDVLLYMFSMFELPKVRCFNGFRLLQSKLRTENKTGVFLTVTSSEIKAMDKTWNFRLQTETSGTSTFSDLSS